MRKLPDLRGKDTHGVAWRGEILGGENPLRRPAGTESGENRTYLDGRGGCAKNPEGDIKGERFHDTSANGENQSPPFVWEKVDQFLLGVLEAGKVTLGTLFPL